MYSVYINRGSHSDISFYSITVVYFYILCFVIDIFFIIFFYILLNFLQAPHKWRDAWGSYFDNGVPLDYAQRIAYLEKEITKFPASEMHPCPYGVGKPFPQIDKDHRRKIFNPNPLDKINK